MTNEQSLMQNCINLALRGAGYASPNPLVGCVIMKDGELIGKGYHEKYGGPHAEVNAVNDAKRNGHSLKGSVVYVNLEPCSHTGLTPPCAQLLIAEQVSEVVIGLKDPNPLVNGRGIKALMNSGIKVATGIHEEECRNLNRFFIKHVTTGYPFITLKIPQTLDGNIALNNYDSKWITNESSRRFVHYLRSYYDGVMIGKQTALKDNPELTVRLVEGRNPYRILFDRNLSLKENLKIFRGKEAGKTIIITGIEALNKNPDKYPAVKKIPIKVTGGMINMRTALKKLSAQGIASIIVEGGAKVFSQFIKADLFDDMYIFIAPKISGGGISPFRHFEINRMSRAKTLNLRSMFQSEDDIVLHYTKK